MVTTVQQLNDLLTQQTVDAQAALQSPATLPSATSALALVNGVPGALLTVVAHTTLRAGIIGLGLWLSGENQRVVRRAFVSSLSIEAFVLAWAAYQKSKQV